MYEVPEELVRERNYLKRRGNALLKEYSIKVTYDFSRYIYIGVKENCNITLGDAIQLITTCSGYEAHRLVYYKRTAINIYARFTDHSCVNAAINCLQRQEGYITDKVDAILKFLYLEEMIKGNFPWTLALVSIEGRAEHTNPLSQDVLQGMLMQFGDPRINTYQIGSQVEHVQVLFSSMSEALGAAIVHGHWMRECFEENPRFYYNIRLMGSEKEAALLRGIQPEDKRGSDKELEAFEMDIFVQKMETKTISPRTEEMSYLSDSIAPNAFQNFRNYPRVREFRSRFSRGRGNGGRGSNVNTQWQYENRSNSGRFRNYANQTIPLQEFINTQKSS